MSYSYNRNLGVIHIMEGFKNSKSDSFALIHIAECFARMGSDVSILHPIHYKSKDYKTVFSGLIGTKYERKCPDLKIDAYFYEYESYVRPWNKRKLSNMISDGLRQSSRIIIDNRDGTSTRQILRSIRSRLNLKAPIEEVWVYNGEFVVRVYP
jgi:hypothetical protein